MTGRPRADSLLDLARHDWLDLAACGRSNVEFIDVTEAEADDLARAYCYRCPVLRPCHDLGQQLAPHRHACLYGARYWRAGERP